VCFNTRLTRVTWLHMRPIRPLHRARQGGPVHSGGHSPEHQAAYPGFENLDELQGLLGPAKKGTLDHDPFSRDVGKVTNDGEYLLELNSE
jgi:hypothetical protein